MKIAANVTLTLNYPRHSAIRFVTPEQRHLGEDKQVLLKRQRLYEKARNWTPVGAVTLNPERVDEVSFKAA